MRFVLTVIALFLGGCGGEKIPPGMPKPVPCDVVVIQDDKPLGGAMVRLRSVDGASWTAMGLTDDAGKATLYTMDRFKGAVPGKYKALVTKRDYEPGDPIPNLRPGEIPTPEMTQGLRPAVSFSLVEEQYGSLETTPLEIEVSKKTRKHTIDVGKAVRIKIKDERRDIQ